MFRNTLAADTVPLHIKITCLLLLLLAATLTTKAQPYQPLKLFDMAATADVITYGAITKVDNDYYYLYGFEHKRARTFKIRKPAGRQSPARREPYTAGQHLFVFLKKYGPEFQVISPGPEGEIPVVGDSLVIDMQCFMPETVTGLAPKGLTPEYRRTQTFAVGQKKVFGLRFTPRYLYQSIMAFRDCYQVILKRPNTYASYTCFNFFDRTMREKTEAQKRKSKLMKLLYMDMEKAQIKNCK